MPVSNYCYRTLRWLVVLPCLLLLSGCFQYDLTLRFDHQLQGQIKQVITLGDRAAAVANGTLAPWLKTLETRTRQLGGTVAETGYNQRSLVVPFTTSADLVNQFNQLFADQPPTQEQPNAGPASTEMASTLTIPDLGQVPYKLAIDQRDWLFASRTHLTYDIDLQQLPTAPASAANEWENRPWADLSFRLQVPWGLSQVLPTSAAPDDILPNGARWQLKSGHAYHIEVWFWVPSLVALGAVVITLVVILGYFLRYRVLGRGKPAPSR